MTDRGPGHRAGVFLTREGPLLAYSVEKLVAEAGVLPPFFGVMFSAPASPDFSFVKRVLLLSFGSFRS